jgi:hypothetical protein
VAVRAKADLDIAKAQMSLPGKDWLEETMAAKYHALNGGTTKEARLQFLAAYKEAIKTHEASLLAKDMELVALHLSWGMERVASAQNCKLDLDVDWAQCINLCQQCAAPV